MLLYLIGWILIPAGPTDDAVPGTPWRPRLIIGLVLVVVGGGMLANQLIPGLSEYIPPLLLMVVGLVLLAGFRRD